MEKPAGGTRVIADRVLRERALISFSAFWLVVSKEIALIERQ